LAAFGRLWAFFFKKFYTFISQVVIPYWERPEITPKGEKRFFPVKKAEKEAGLFPGNSLGN